MSKEKTFTKAENLMKAKTYSKSNHMKIPNNISMMLEEGFDIEKLMASTDKKYFNRVERSIILNLISRNIAILDSFKRGKKNYADNYQPVSKKTKYVVDPDGSTRKASFEITEKTIASIISEKSKQTMELLSYFRTTYSDDGFEDRNKNFSKFFKELSLHD